jgi:plastocyanin
MAAATTVGHSCLRVMLPVALTVCCVTAWAQAVSEVRIREYRFSPAEVRVRPGDTVRWINDEKRTSHSVLFVGAGGLESDRFFPGESWERRFEKPGRFEYRCGPHPEMNGVVVVE